MQHRAGRRLQPFGQMCRKVGRVGLGGEKISVSYMEAGQRIFKALSAQGEPVARHCFGPAVEVGAEHLGVTAFVQPIAG